MVKITRLALVWILLASLAIMLILQAGSYVRILLATQESSGSDVGSSSVPEPVDATSHDTYHHHEYSIVWSYIGLLAIGYCALAIWNCWRPLDGLPSHPSMQEWQLHLRRWSQYEFNVLNYTWTPATCLQLIGLATLNGVFLGRQQVLQAEEMNAIGESHHDIHQEYANRTAQLALANMTIAVLLSVRYSVLWRGIAFERTIAWHKWFGQLAGLLALYHICFQIVKKYNILDRSLYLVFTSSLRYKTGFCMMLALSGLVTGSHPFIRSVSYRLFRWSHAVSFLTLVVMGGLHHWMFIVFYIAVVCVWAVDMWRRQALPAKLLSAKVLPGNIIKLQVQPPYNAPPADHRPGRYVFLSLSNSLLARWLDVHPFTIARVDHTDLSQEGAVPAAASITHATTEHQVFTMYIRALGRQTRELHRLISSNDVSSKTALSHLRLSYPLGQPSLTRGLYDQYEVAVLIAEGVGITPWISVLQYLAQRQHQIQTKQVHLIWSIRNTETLDAFSEELRTLLLSLDHVEYAIQVYVTRESPFDAENAVPSAVGLEAKVIKGRPDYSAVLEEIRHNHPKVDVALGLCAHNTTIRICGNLARSSSFSNGQARWDVRTERFEL